MDCVPGTVSKDKLSCRLPCEPGNWWSDGGCKECIGDVVGRQLKCLPCENNDYFSNTLKKCVPCIGTVSDDTKECTPCGDNKNFDDDTKECVDCFGVVSEDDLTCDPCNLDGTNNFFDKDATPMACAECVGELVDDAVQTGYPTGCDKCTADEETFNGSTCDACVGTIGTKVVDNVCSIDCPDNEYFKDGACVDCFGDVSADFKDCKACNADETNNYFDTTTLACTTTECVGELNDVDHPGYPTGCDLCIATEYFTKATAMCDACGDKTLAEDGITEIACPNCIGTFTSADLICAPCADTEYFTEDKAVCAACGDTIKKVDGSTVITTCPNCIGTY